MSLSELILRPIGLYRVEEQVQGQAPYQVPRQPDSRSHVGVIELLPQQQFEQALQDLEGFERLWVIYQFHQNKNWKPQVLPPRGTDSRKGVFATRSPHRPNPLGISCVTLVKIHQRSLWIQGADLLDQSPILDLKPYIPEWDAFPDSRVGWLEGVESQKYAVRISEGLIAKTNWLRENKLSELLEFLERQLEFEPFDSRRKRVSPLSADSWELAYRTWRIAFSNPSPKTLLVINITSAYRAEELTSQEDPYGDKDLHRAFNQIFNQASGSTAIS